MKSQLQRILNSDLSEYKIAVSDHMTNLDHFEQCLTERSAFMKNFNDLIKQELQRINKQPPNQFDAIEILDNVIEIKNSNIAQERNQIILKSESENVRAVLKEMYCENKENVKNQSRDHQQLTKARKSVEKYIIKAKIQLQSVCKDILSYIEITKRKLGEDMKKSVTGIVENVNTIYQHKINQLENTILSLKVENFSLNEKLKQRTAIQKENLKCQNRKDAIDQVNKEKQFNILSRMNSHLLKTQKPEQELNQYVNSPIYAFESVNRSNKGFTTDRYAQITYRESDQQPSFRVDNFYQTTAYQSEHDPHPMKIKNDNAISWKHYVCDLEFTDFKEIKSHPFQNSTKLSSYPSSSSEVSVHQVQPNMPALLRRTSSNEQYNLVTVRPLIVSYPPVQQGFGMLMQGNQIVYKGMWKYRKFHGRGKLTLQEYSYQGQFQTGLMHGRGVLKIGNTQYTGQFVENKAQGQGTLRIGNTTVQGLWRNNVLVEKY